MRKRDVLVILLVFLCITSFIQAQDSIYVIKLGKVDFRCAVEDIDSISFFNSTIDRDNIIDQIANNDKYSIFYSALKATGLSDSLSNDRDKTYDYRDYFISPLTQGSGSYDELPKSRIFGYTVLMESDSVMNNFGIHNFEDLKNYAASIYNSVYPEDANIKEITNRKNSLNRFIAYHLINKKLSISAFIDKYDTDNMIKTFDLYEYLEPMCPNSLIEVKKERASGLTNLINKSSKTGEAIHIIYKFSDENNDYNGYYYGIDKMMTYDQATQNELSNKRLRFDAASLFPEITNNNMRYYDPSNPRSWQLPKGYVKRIKNPISTTVTYLNAFGGYIDYEGDEIQFKGFYDFEITTPPIPAGMYEIRIGYIPTAAMGAAEFYVDRISVGAPVDLRLPATDSEIGWSRPNTDTSDYNGYENDKALYNHGYMKGPACFQDVLGWWYAKNTARNSQNALRKVIGTFTFESTKNHIIGIRAIAEGQFILDYIEFIPVKLIETEGID